MKIHLLVSAVLDELEKVAEYHGKMKELDKYRQPLSPEERTEVMKAKAVWHHGLNGKPTPAVWKADHPKHGMVYGTNTHRAVNYATTLKGAINRYHRFIKSTA